MSSHKTDTIPKNKRRVMGMALKDQTRYIYREDLWRETLKLILIFQFDQNDESSEIMQIDKEDDSLLNIEVVPDDELIVVAPGSKKKKIA
ncbi:3378_t:CDS:2 [Entrophospora sp. SA101]|nr:10540_t:CDS:2 [Entrophospora sp. SA101]CAJ0878612.1 3378_t:CDS:2 [Entrophospora sp. SA101]